jgi:hypothetical protein
MMVDNEKGAEGVHGPDAQVQQVEERVPNLYWSRGGEEFEQIIMGQYCKSNWLNASPVRIAEDLLAPELIDVVFSWLFSLVTLLAINNRFIHPSVV